MVTIRNSRCLLDLSLSAFRPRATLFFSVIGGLALFSATASAQNDSKAKALSEKALFDDYLNLRFDAAEAKLKEAVSLCESGCSKSVTAQMYRDLGVVLVAGKQDREGGINAFINALQRDSSIALDPDLSSPEVESAFEEARKQAASGVAPEPADEPDEPAAAVDGPDANGAITHDPPTEQVVNTPLPLFVGVKPGEDVSNVTAFIRGFGMPRFKPLDLSKLPDGFGGETKCSDVGATTGEFQYYIVAYDEEGTGVGRVGSEDEPVVVLIKDELDGDPPSLPGKEPPQQCEVQETSSDCPPDFPGCGLGEWGAGEEEPEEPEEPKGSFKRHWLSLSFQSDFVLMPAGADVCSTNRAEGWECFYGDGTYRNPSHGEPGLPDGRGRGEVQSGIVPGTMRVMLGYDFAALEWLTLGIRAGFAFNGGPQLKTFEAFETLDPATGVPVTRERELSNPAFLPLHAEGRLGFWMAGQDSVVRPHFTLSGGIAQVDAKVVTPIVEPRKQNPVDCPNPADTTCTQANIEAWRRAGTGFGAAGLGLMVPFGKTHGVDLEGKFMILMPETGQALGAQLSYYLGL